MNGLVDSFGGIDKSVAEPIYQQIKNIIEQKIIAGVWRAGAKLPSENELVSALNVSRMTINRALRELTQKGLIKRVHGVGSFVAETPRHASLIELKDIALEVADSGHHHSSRVLALTTRRADKQVADQMQLGFGATLYYLQAVHFQDDLPIQLETRYVAPELVPDFLQQDFVQATSTSYLLRQFRPHELEHIVRAIIPDQQTCRLLSIDASEPCLQLSRRTWINQRVVTYVTMTYPSCRYDLGARYASNDFPARESQIQL